MRRRARDLLPAGIGGYHSLEMICETNRGLSIAGAAIEGDAVTVRQSRQQREERFRI